MKAVLAILCFAASSAMARAPIEPGCLGADAAREKWLKASATHKHYEIVCKHLYPKTREERNLIALPEGTKRGLCSVEGLFEKIESYSHTTVRRKCTFDKDTGAPLTVDIEGLDFNFPASLMKIEVKLLQD